MRAPFTPRRALADNMRAPRTSDAYLDPTGAVAARSCAGWKLLSRAIYLTVLGGLTTAGLPIAVFLAALPGIGHGQIVAAMFAAALVLLIASLVELTGERRVYMAHMHLE
jgi:uncharacterized membrane protein